MAQISAPPTVAIPYTPPILRLPPELRAQVWDIFYSSVSPPWIRYLDGEGGHVVTNHSINLAPTYACKQFREEAWPAIWRHLVLHLSREATGPYQHGRLPDPQQRQHIRRVVWYMACFDYDRELAIWGLPTRPVKLHRFPRLREFVIAQADEVHVLWPLATAQSAASDPDLAPPVVWPALDTYTAVEKAASWYRGISGVERTAYLLALRQCSADALIATVARHGKGGWLSRLVDPVAFPAPIEFEDPLTGDEWDMDDQYDLAVYDPDLEDGLVVRPGETREDAEKRELGELRAMASSVEILLEVEVYVVGNMKYYDRYEVAETLVEEPIIIVVDVRQRKIVEARQLSPDEHQYRVKHRQSPCYNFVTLLSTHIAT
ncbi:uncharacterized protein B0I36DRAFT_369479 [Microdochium trichocladiopsis]|uniref:Uncharacterized protein n=1 Tax=Microdochium trichocladiopsis TaxID=1682393 RepID=A0A9P8XSN4_9PEZI|nr:uncharacterized protein B0I36DRAFT_369479 [Microdochium trichocladiopsis]KAH7014531.1 hypothetical protein B0I36DRAFT_369479 [Microdochium trichocladiopsis]